MFFISKGNCTVRVRAEASKDPPAIRKLIEGAHFGEINLLYKDCARSATVISNNYNTLSRLRMENFKDVISEYPEYEKALKKHVIATYGNMAPVLPNAKEDKLKNTRYAVDPKIKFIKEIIKGVEYFAKIDDEVFFDIMFALKSKSYEKDESIMSEDSNAEALLIVEEGLLDVYTSFEANEFVLERLSRGTVLNHRAYFMKDSMYVDIRCSKEAKILHLPLDSIKAIIERYTETKFNMMML